LRMQNFVLSAVKGKAARRVPQVSLDGMGLTEVLRPTARLALGEMETQTESHPSREVLEVQAAQEPRVLRVPRVGPVAVGQAVPLN
jgi:hypothetical protein